MVIVTSPTLLLTKFFKVASETEPRALLGPSVVSQPAISMWGEIRSL